MHGADLHPLVDVGMQVATTAVEEIVVLGDGDSFDCRCAGLLQQPSRQTLKDTNPIWSVLGPIVQWVLNTHPQTTTKSSFG